MSDQNLHDGTNTYMGPTDDATEASASPAPEAHVVVEGGGTFISTDYSLEDGGWLCTGQWSSAKEKLIGAPEMTILFPETSVRYILFKPVSE